MIEERGTEIINGKNWTSYGLTGRTGIEFNICVVTRADGSFDMVTVQRVAKGLQLRCPVGKWFYDKAEAVAAYKSIRGDLAAVLGVAQ